MKIEDLTMKQVKEMSQDDLFFWGEIFAKEQQAKQIRKVLLNHLEVEGATDGNIIKLGADK